MGGCGWVGVGEGGGRGRRGEAGADNNTIIEHKVVNLRTYYQGTGLPNIKSVCLEASILCIILNRNPVG